MRCGHYCWRPHVCKKRHRAVSPLPPFPPHRMNAQAAADAEAPDATALLRELERRLAAGRRQLIARAVGMHRRSGLRVLDATGGFGRDAMLLAALGAEVVCCERHPEAFQRLQAAWELLPEATAGRLRLHLADARHHLRAQSCDVVFLDPMYAPTGKQALPRAAAQNLRALVGEDADADSLLAPARAAALRRVVVKRALRAPPLANAPPMQSLRGNSVRFDLYAPKPEEQAE